MKKSIIPLLAVLFFGCSNDFSDSSIDVLRPEKEDSVERGEMLLMPIIISRMIHPLFGVKMVC